tara:strand:- start:1237 stop:2265 length:1029 start_codon:yes stop_codon:yes gene_type:complete
MANYDAVSGLRIPVVSSDPSAPIEGELWYNTTVDKFRGYGLYQVNAAWSSSPASLNAGRRSCEGAGTVSSGIGFLGYIGGYPRYGASENWNGSSWTNKPSTPTPLGSACSHVGDASAAAGIGGNYYSGPSGLGATNYHFEWNGSSFSNSTSLPVQRNNMAAAGTRDSFAVVGGGDYNGGSQPSNKTFEWNGSSWSETGNLPYSTPGSYTQGFGSQSAMGVLQADAPSTAWYVYNGSSWSTSPASLNRNVNGRSMWGSTSSAVAAGGGTPSIPYVGTETWNGSSWSSSADSNSNHIQALRSNNPGSTSPAGWVFGGGPGNGVSAGEIFAGPINSVQKVDLDFS